MDFPTTQLVEQLRPFLREMPPWLVMSGLAGIVCAAAFFVVAGRGFRSLPTYLVLGATVAPLCHSLQSGFPTSPPPFTIGEVDLAVVAVGTWLLLSIARALRL